MIKDCCGKYDHDILRELRLRARVIHFEDSNVQTNGQVMDQRMDHDDQEEPQSYFINQAIIERGSYRETS